MKKIITATFLTAAATAAHADNLGLNAGAEYSVEAETFEITSGADYTSSDFAL